MPSFIPRAEGELTLWLNNLAAKIGVQGPIVGLTPSDITSISDSCVQTSNLINQVEQQKAALKTLVSQKTSLRDASFTSISNYAARIKAHAAYTDAIGQDLGIIATQNSPDLSSMKPVLTAETFPGYVRIKFTKQGFSAVNIYTRIKGNIGWTFLARDTNSPYDDNRPVATPGTAEAREYMGIGLDGDDETGQQSDIISVVFGG